MQKANQFINTYTLPPFLFQIIFPMLYFYMFIALVLLSLFTATHSFILKINNIKRDQVAMRQYMKVKKILHLIQTNQSHKIASEMQVIDDVELSADNINEYTIDLRFTQLPNATDEHITNTAQTLMKDCLEYLKTYHIPYHIALETVIAFVIKLSILQHLSSTEQTKYYATNLAEYQKYIAQQQAEIAQNDIIGYHLYLIELHNTPENHILAKKLQSQFLSKPAYAAALCKTYSIHISKDSPTGLGVYNIQFLDPLLLDTISNQKMPTAYITQTDDKIQIYLVVRKSTIYNAPTQMSIDVQSFLNSTLSGILDSIDNHNIIYIDNHM